MKQKFSRAPLRARLGIPVLVASAVLCVAVMPWTAAHAQTTPTPPPYCSAPAPGQPAYCINWSALDTGGINRSHSTCYRLSGTIGQLSPAPGYASQQTPGATNYGVFSGFWAGAPTTGLDEIFFNGFEGCGQ